MSDKEGRQLVNVRPEEHLLPDREDAHAVQQVENLARANTRVPHSDVTNVLVGGVVKSCFARDGSGQPRTPTSELGWWMVATTVRPAAARRRKDVMTPNADALSRPLVGSSRMIRAGWCTNGSSRVEQVSGWL
jgi:hypothetical protein